MKYADAPFSYFLAFVFVSSGPSSGHRQLVFCYNTTHFNVSRSKFIFMFCGNFHLGWILCIIHVHHLDARSFSFYVTFLVLKRRPTSWFALWRNVILIGLQSSFVCERASHSANKSQKFQVLTVSRIFLQVVVACRKKYFYRRKFAIYCFNHLPVMRVTMMENFIILRYCHKNITFLFILPSTAQMQKKMLQKNKIQCNLMP